MTDVFSQNDREGAVPNFQKTLDGLRELFAPTLKILPTPLMMSSGLGKPVEFETPYFTGKYIPFSKLFNQTRTLTPTNFAFFIIANDFGPRFFSSHSMVGYWNYKKQTLYIFDPNGDISTTEESVYTGKSFNIYDSCNGQLKNPLYRTLLVYFKKTLKVKNVHVYDGEPIPCPAYHSSCVYRSLMYITGLSKYGTIDESVMYTKMVSANAEQAMEVKKLTLYVFSKNMKEARSILVNLLALVLNP